MTLPKEELLTDLKIKAAVKDKTKKALHDGVLF